VNQDEIHLSPHSIGHPAGHGRSSAGNAKDEGMHEGHLPQPIREEAGGVDPIMKKRQDQGNSMVTTTILTRLNPAEYAQP